MKLLLYYFISPCSLCDLVGFGVAIATGTQFIMNFPERTYKSMLIPLMQEDKRAGRFFWFKHSATATPLASFLEVLVLKPKHILIFMVVSGETTRKGFYVYNDKRKASPDPELKKYIEKARSMSGVTVDPKVLSLTLPPFNFYWSRVGIRRSFSACFP